MKIAVEFYFTTNIKYNDFYHVSGQNYDIKLLPDSTIICDFCEFRNIYA